MKSLEEYKEKQKEISELFNNALNSEDGIVLESAIKAANLYNKIDSIIEASTDIYKRVIDNPTLVKNIGFISSDNIYNENVYIKEFNKPLRGRSEILILDGDKVLLRKDSKNGYSLPGGGWEKDEDHNISAEREANEECRVKVKDVSYSNTYAAIFPPKDWVKEKIDKENWWYGEYCEVYVGTYDGKFTGKVDLVDQDNKMKNESKFYTIDSVKDILLDQHKKAIEEYKQNVVKEDYQGKHTYYHYIYFEDDGSTKYDGCTVDINDLGSVYRTPFDISMIPNNMGINLCNVEKISWEELFDGQLVNIEVRFKPNINKDNLYFESANECVEYIEEYMRPATDEERESVQKYVNSISKPTGVNFFDLLDESTQSNIDTIVFDLGDVLVKCDNGDVQLMDYTLGLIKSLKDKGYKLYYLSNWGKKNFDYNDTKGSFEFLNQFDGGLFDWEINISKPNHTIYQILIDKFQLDPSRCLFFDDKYENIESAKGIGMNAQVFDKVKGLENIIMLPDLNTVNESINFSFDIEHSIDEGATFYSRNKVKNKESIMIHIDDEDTQGEGYFKDPYIGVYDGSTFNNSKNIVRVGLYTGELLNHKNTKKKGRLGHLPENSPQLKELPEILKKEVAEDTTIADLIKEYLSSKSPNRFDKTKKFNNFKKYTDKRSKDKLNKYNR